jgi:hypothetical protein
MIIVVDEETGVDDLHRALRRGGYILRCRPDGIFDMLRVNEGRATCENASCKNQAVVRDETVNLCAKHWSEVRGG